MIDNRAEYRTHRFSKGLKIGPAEQATHPLVSDRGRG